MAKLSFEKFQNVIDGQLRDADKHYYGINPFDTQHLWPVPIATKQDVDDAVAAGVRAFGKWRRTTVKERRERLEQFADCLAAQKADWTETVSKETGQSPETADSEIDSACEWLKGIAQLELPEYVTHEDEDVIVTTKYFPLGVVAAICPWNFPIFLAAAKIASALLTGNVIIVKPSPFTPYTTLKLAEVAQSFFPPGVFQALGGDDNLGPWLTLHPKIAKISFTGSTATGKKVMAAAASTLKRVTLELGGNDAAIVCEDVNLEKVVGQIFEDAFIHAGQSCVATKRIYVHASLYDKFRDAFVALSRELKPGVGLLSPVQNKMQYDKVRNLLEDCEKYDLVSGPSREGGYYIPATVVSDPPENSRIVQEEPFGPIVPILKWEDEDDVISRVNDTDQGLGVSLYCNDWERADRIGAELEAGSVWINRGVVALPTALFGGIKQSGLGGEWGQLGLLTYCDARTFHVAKV